MASFLEDIRNDLVCRICEGHTRPGKKHWYRCMRLHQICQDCKGKNEKCSCEEPISKEYCKMTEKWLNVEGLKFNCVNTKSGCQETHAENGLENHESECVYRLVSCPSLTPGVEDCESKVAFQDIIHHFEKHHFEIEELDLSKNHTVKTSTDIDASGVYIYGDLLKCIFKNRTFLLTSMTSEDEDVFYFWVYLLGSRNEAKHFSYTLTRVSLEHKNYKNYTKSTQTINDFTKPTQSQHKVTQSQHKVTQSQHKPTQSDTKSTQTNTK